MKLFLAPHNDDEALFGAFTIQREKPLVLVVTDGFQHLERHGIQIERRRAESFAGCAVLGAPCAFLGLKDTGFTEQELWDRLRYFKPQKVYAPAPLENGNEQHNMVGRVAIELWGPAARAKAVAQGEKKPTELFLYSTYRKDDLEPKGDVEIKPTTEEREIKLSALGEYRSQMEVNRPHFDAVYEKSEFFINA